MNLPYNDDDMIYDYKAHRYVLTLDYARRNGIDLESRVKSVDTNAASTIINTVLRTASVQIYAYIFAHNMNRRALEYVIAKSETARSIVRDAMREQLAYLVTQGDLSRTTEKDKREMYIDMMAKLILDTDVPELGTCLTTVTPIVFCPPSYEKGGY